MPLQKDLQEQASPPETQEADGEDSKSKEGGQL